MRASLGVITAALAGCTTPTAPTAPFVTWQLQELDGHSLPHSVGNGASAIQLIADTLDLRPQPRGANGTGSLAFVTRDAAGVVTHSRVTIGYTIANGRIAIDFHCLYNQICVMIYVPLIAVLDGTELRFQDAAGREARRYHRVE